MDVEPGENPLKPIADLSRRVAELEAENARLTRALEQIRDRERGELGGSSYRIATEALAAPAGAELIDGLDPSYGDPAPGDPGAG